MTGQLFLPYRALNQFPTEGDDNSNDFLTNTANKGRQIICNYYKNAPKPLVNSPTNVGNRLLLNNLCKDPTQPNKGLPNEPQPYLVGGNCPALYDVYYTRSSIYPNSEGEIRSSLANAIGPISQNRLFVRNNGEDYGTSYSAGEGSLAGAGLEIVQQRGNSEVQIYSNAGAARFSISGVQITRLVRIDGQPDNCGNTPPESYNNTEINNDNRVTNITLQNENNNTNITLPFFFIPPDFEVNFTPQMNLGGLNFNFQLGGVEITFNPDNVGPGLTIIPHLEFLLPQLPPINIPVLNNIENNINNLSNNSTSISNTLNTLNNNLNTNLELNNEINNEIKNTIIPILLPFPDLFPDGGCEDYSDKLEEILEEIRDIKNTEIEITVPKGTCVDVSGLNEFEINEEIRTVNMFLASAEILKAEQQLERDRKECLGEENNSVIAIPDWWQTRLGADREQTIWIFRRPSTRNYHGISIPHCKIKNKPTNNFQNPFPAYIAGNYQALIILKDNSKFIALCKDRNEAERISTIALELIEDEYTANNYKLIFSERQGQNIAEEMRIPKKIQYFSTGQKNIAPDWDYKILGIELNKFPSQ